MFRRLFAAPACCNMESKCQNEEMLSQMLHGRRSDMLQKALCSSVVPVMLCWVLCMLCVDV